MKVYNTAATNNTPVINSKNTVSKDGFIKILAAQLQNQDPMNAKDNSEFVAQMAQFAALEQMQNLNTSMNTLLLSQKIHEGNSMVGKLVRVENKDGTYTSGEVTSIKAVKGNVNVVIEGKQYSIDDVVEVAKNDKYDNEIKKLLEEMLETGQLQSEILYSGLIGADSGTVETGGQDSDAGTDSGSEGSETDVVPGN